jgi:hypothetical protein
MSLPTDRFGRAHPQVHDDSDAIQSSHDDLPAIDIRSL